MSRLIITLDTADVTHQDVVNALHEVERRLTSYIPDHDELNGTATYDFSDTLYARALFEDLEGCLEEDRSAHIQDKKAIKIIRAALKKAYGPFGDVEEDEDD